MICIRVLVNLNAIACIKLLTFYLDNYITTFPCAYKKLAYFINYFKQTIIGEIILKL